MKKITILALTMLFLAATAGLLSGCAPEGEVKTISVSDTNFLTARSDFMDQEIQAFFEQHSSPLATYKETVGGNDYSAAELTWMASQQRDFGINPKVLLTTLYLENGLAVPVDQKYSTYMNGMASTFWSAYDAYKNGATVVPLKTGEITFSGINAASYAVSKYFAPGFGSREKLEERLDLWITRYQDLFVADPRLVEAADRTAPVVKPFLILPFHQPSKGFVKVNSFFDHQAPKSFDDYLLRFDGKGFGSSGFNPCTIGVNCYGGHNAIDYSIANRTPLFAAAAGKVVYRYLNKDSSQGTVDSGLIIDHGNGYRTLYWHQDEIYVQVGDSVTQGQQIGLSGNIGKSSGAHLHFGLRRVIGSKDVDPYGWWGDTVSDPWGDSFWAWQSNLIANDGEPQVQLFFRDFWNFDSNGYGGSAWWTYSVTSSVRSNNWGMWGTYISKPGKYHVYAYWPKTDANATAVKYKIFHGSTSSTVSVNQAASGGKWVKLGSYNFAQGNTAVILTDVTGESRKRVYFDAVRWVLDGTEEPTEPTEPAPTPAPAEAPGAGTYDDAYAGIQYKGKWKNESSVGPLNNVIKYSSKVGDTVSFTFKGKQVNLIYTGYYNRGAVDISIDNVWVERLNCFDPERAWQEKWYGPALADGTHTITLKHVSGEVVDIDAFVVNSVPETDPRRVDDMDSRVVYSGVWDAAPMSGPYKKTLHSSSRIGNQASFTFNGQQVILVYSGLKTYGKVELKIDGAVYDILSQASRDRVWQSRWYSPVLPAGQHTLTLTHISGGKITLDGFQVNQTAVPNPYRFDDADSRIVYTGKWNVSTEAGPYNGTPPLLPQYQR